MKFPPGQRHTSDSHAVSLRMYREWVLTKVELFERRELENATNVNSFDSRIGSQWLAQRVEHRAVNPKSWVRFPHRPPRERLKEGLEGNIWSIWQLTGFSDSPRWPVNTICKRSAVCGYRLLLAKSKDVDDEQAMTDFAGNRKSEIATFRIASYLVQSELKHAPRERWGNSQMFPESLL